MYLGVKMTRCIYMLEQIIINPSNQCLLGTPQEHNRIYMCVCVFSLLFLVFFFSLCISICNVCKLVYETYVRLLNWLASWPVLLINSVILDSFMGFLGSFSFIINQKAKIVIHEIWSFFACFN